MSSTFELVRATEEQTAALFQDLEGLGIERDPERSLSWFGRDGNIMVTVPIQGWLMPLLYFRAPLAADGETIVANSETLELLGWAAISSKALDCEERTQQILGVRAAHCTGELDAVFRDAVDEYEALRDQDVPFEEAIEREHDLFYGLHASLEARSAASPFERRMYGYRYQLLRNEVVAADDTSILLWEAKGAFDEVRVQYRLPWDSDDPAAVERKFYRFVTDDTCP